MRALCGTILAAAVAVSAHAGAVAGNACDSAGNVGAVRLKAVCEVIGGDKA